MVLLGQLNCEFGQNFSGISLQSGIESSITIDHNESKWGLIQKELFFEIVKIELRFTAINGEVDGLEGFKVDDDFLLAG